MTKTKTKTIVAVALTVFSIGSMLAGMYYYYGSRGLHPISNPSVNGVCGSSNGQTFASAPSINLCSKGTPATVTGSGPWYWSCTGTNGGTTASCSANIQNGPILTLSRASYNFGAVDIGDSETTTITASNTGNADLTLNAITVSGTGFSRNGGTCANNGQVLAPDATCTIIVAFSPTGDVDYTGNLSIPSNDDNVNVALSGHGVEQAPPNGSPDLIVPMLSAPGGISNDLAFYMDVCVKNQGTAPAGSFTVRGYLSPDRTPGNTGDIFLFDWVISSLGEGQTECNSIRVVVDGAPIHSYLYFLVKADASNQVVESNEDNNLRFSQTRIQR